MIIIHTNGIVTNAIWNKDKLTVSLEGTIEIDEIRDNRTLIDDILLATSGLVENKYTVNNGQLFKDGILVVPVADVDKSQFRDQYIAVTDRLDQIISANPTGWTQAQFNTQAFSAIQDMARYLLWTIKFIAKFLL